MSVVIYSIGIETNGTEGFNRMPAGHSWRTPAWRGWRGQPILEKDTGHTWKQPGMHEEPFIIWIVHHEDVQATN